MRPYGEANQLSIHSLGSFPKAENSTDMREILGNMGTLRLDRALVLFGNSHVRPRASHVSRQGSDHTLRSLDHPAVGLGFIVPLK